MSGPGPDVRPRWGRIATLGAALTVTLVAALAGLGVVSPGSTAMAEDTARPASYDVRSPSTGPTTGPADPTTAPTTGNTAGTTTGHGSTHTPAPPGMGTSHLQDRTTLPAHSGSGRRIVFSQHLQRVWLVADSHHEGDGVKKTYLVSGSLTDNLQPGTYAVTQRERHAIGIDNSGTMQYFVVFTAGPTGAAIGFHSIPVKNGHLTQTVAQLGTPRSHGCIRQWLPDAIALWHFAPIGTKVVVVA